LLQPLSHSPRPAALGSYLDYAAGDPSLSPWQIISGSVDLIGQDFWQAHEGNQSLDLASWQDGIIPQSVFTIPGQSYNVIFAYANNYGTTSAQALVDVSGFRSLPSSTISHSGSTAVNMNYSLFAGSFVADSGTASIRITSQSSTWYAIAHQVGFL
jgi:hypothetical protein